MPKPSSQDPQNPYMPMISNPWGTSRVERCPPEELPYISDLLLSV